MPLYGVRTVPRLSNISSNAAAYGPRFPYPSKIPSNFLTGCERVRVDCPFSVVRMRTLTLTCCTTSAVFAGQPREPGGRTRTAHAPHFGSSRGRLVPCTVAARAAAVVLAHWRNTKELTRGQHQVAGEAQSHQRGPQAAQQVGEVVASHGDPRVP